MGVSLRADYLLRIRNCMVRHFSWKEINLTLEDLDLLFQAGLENGKNEEEICNEIGSPQKFVNSLYLERAQDRFVSKILLKRIGIFCFIIFLMIMFLHYYENHDTSAITYNIAAIILFSFAFFIFSGGCMYRIQNKSVIQTKICLIIQLVLFIVAVIEQLFLFIIMRIFENAHSFAQMTNLLCDVGGVFAIILLLCSFLGCYKGYNEIFGILIQSIGLLCSSLSCKDFLTRLDAPGKIWFCILPYIISLGISMLFNFVLNKERTTDEL